METKCLEIRDKATCIPAVAIRMSSANQTEDRFLWRCGYPRDGRGVVLLRLEDQRAASDPYEWADRTHQAAHLFIEEHFSDLREGDVVDVRVLLGEAETPARPEIWDLEKGRAVNA